MYADVWREESASPPPVGASVIDNETRGVIATLIEALLRIGISQLLDGNNGNEGSFERDQEGLETRLFSCLQSNRCGCATVCLQTLLASLAGKS